MIEARGLGLLAAEALAGSSKQFLNLAQERFKSSEYLRMLQDLAPELEECAPGRLRAAKLPALEIVIRMGDGGTAGMFNFDDVGGLGGPAERERLEMIAAGPLASTLGGASASVTSDPIGRSRPARDSIARTVAARAIASATKPFHDPKLRELLDIVRQKNEITIDIITEDEILEAVSSQSPEDKATEVVDKFKQFIADDYHLRRVTVGSMSDVKSALDFFMGKNTPARKEYIIENLIADIA